MDTLTPLFSCHSMTLFPLTLFSTRSLTKWPPFLIIHNLFMSIFHQVTPFGRHFVKVSIFSQFFVKNCDGPTIIRTLSPKNCQNLVLFSPFKTLLLVFSLNDLLGDLTRNTLISDLSCMLSKQAPSPPKLSHPRLIIA